MVEETLSAFFSIPTVLPSRDILQQQSNQGPTAQLEVSVNLTKMIAVFGKDPLNIGDQELSGVWLNDVHNQDLKFCAGDEASSSFHPPDELMGLFG